MVRPRNEEVIGGEQISSIVNEPEATPGAATPDAPDVAQLITRIERLEAMLGVGGELGGEVGGMGMGPAAPQGPWSKTPPPPPARMG